MGRFTHKLNLMLWKDIRILKNNKIQLTISIVLPMLVGFIGAGLRIMTNVKHVGTEYYSTVNLERSFGRLIGIIQERRQSIEEHIEGPYHSVYCPMLIIAFAANNLTYFRPIYEAIDAETRKYGVKQLLFFSCEKLRNKMKNEHFLYGICFEEPSDEDSLFYKIVIPPELRDFKQMFISYTWLTNLNQCYQMDPIKKFYVGTEGGPGAVREGVAYIQNIIAVSHLKKFQQDIHYNQIKLGRIANIITKYDPLLKEKSGSITCTILLGYLFPSVFIVTLSVNEKETGVRSYLAVKGIPLPVQLMAWCIILWLITAFSSFIIIIIFKIDWRNGESLIGHSSFFFLLGFLLSYCFANCTFCLMISAVCSSKDTAIPFVTLCWILSFIIYLHNPYNNPFANLYWFFFMPNAITANVMDNVFQLESVNIGCEFSFLFDFLAESIAFYVLLFSGVLFFFMAWGLDKLTPGLYGEPINFLKLCKKKRNALVKRWFYRNIRPSSTTSRGTGYSSVQFDIQGSKYSNMIEPVTNIINVNKSFDKKVLFEDFNLSLYPDEVVACIGSNQSGKTVLSLILGGLIPIDSGVVQINGIDLKKFKQEASDDVGIAFGSHLMLPDLTFMEQLIFYGRINGVKSHHAWNIANNLVNRLKLDEHENTVTKNLNIVLKLCLAVLCAFCGNKSIIILDSVESVFEGSIGTRMCKFILEKKDKKTIFITASSTKIAELLSTRLIFLHSGKVQLNGEIEFLKNSFGKEIVLSCFKTKHFNQEMYTNMVMSSIPNAKTAKNEISPELVFTIPADDTNEVPPLLIKLEEKKKELGLDIFYIRQKNLEDLFRGIIDKTITSIFAESDLERLTMRLSINQDQYKKVTKYSKTRRIIALLKESELASGWKLFWLRFLAILKKQYYSHTVNKFILAFHFLIPFIICSFAAILLKIYSKDIRDGQRHLGIEEYNNAFTLVSSAKRLKNGRSDIILSYRKAWNELPPDKYFYEDLMQANIIEYINEDNNFGLQMKYLLVGMHVGARSVAAKFNSDYLHTDQTSLTLVHNAILRSILKDMHPEIGVTLYPLDAEFDNLQSETNVMRFLSFSLALGLWFVFGLLATGIFYERDSFSIDQINKGLNLSAFWAGYILMVIIKLLIVIPILLIFLYISDYEMFLTSKLTVLLVVIMVLAAFYFQLFKIIYLIVFYEMEQKYIISIFHAIVSLITLSFTSVSNNGADPLSLCFIILPVNYIARLFFFAIYMESTRKMCGLNSIYHVSVYAEDCKMEPNCCELDKDWMEIRGILICTTLIIVASAVLTILIVKLHLIVKLYTCRKIPLMKPHKDQKPEKSDSDILKSSSVPTRATTQPRSETLDTVPIFLNNVGKSVKQQVLVDNVSFIIRRGDCFCILGPQGEEKQMLLRLMCGNARPSYGQIFCFGERAIPKLFQSKKVTIGYCLPDLGRVHFYKVGKYMEMYALSVGIPRRDVSTLCKKLAEYIDILGDYDTIIAKVSSTTKRRMSFVMSFIGFPKIIIMDISLIEVDYNGIYLIMKLVNWYLENDGTLILTVRRASNGALYGTRLGVFINGRMRAIGSLGRICERLAHGYLVVAKIFIKGLTSGRIRVSSKKMTANAALFYCSFIESKFQTASLKGTIGHYVYYFIPHQDASFELIYKTMEAHKVMLRVVDYYITQNSLDMVFDQILEKSSRKIEED